MGEKWERLSPKVVLIANAVITRHLGDAGSFRLHGEDCFVIVFRGLTAEQERARAIAAANDLGQRLLGAQFASAEQPLALAAEVTVADATGADGRLDPDVVARAVSRVRSLIPPEARLANLHATEQDSEESGLRRHLLPSEGTVVDVPVSRRATVPTVMVLTTDFPPIEAAKIGRMGLLYRPSWVAAQRAVAATVCLVQRQAEAESPILSGSGVYDPALPGLGLTIDRAVAQAAALQLEKGCESPLLIVPMALNSLIAVRRMHVTGPLSELPDRIRTGRLVIEIVGVPDGATPGQLAEGVTGARKLSREVAVRGRLARSFAGAARDAGASLVGVDLSELTPDERMGDAALLAALVSLRNQARAAHLSTYVWGIRRRPLLAELVHGGFDLLNGAALMKDQAKPTAPLPAPHSRFVRE